VSDGQHEALLRLRREPPRFRRAVVRSITRITPRMGLVALAGPELAGLEVDEPAASVRLLVPQPGAGLVLPTWTGNEFLLGDGVRPAIRTFTPLRADPAAGELELAIVLHGGGVASRWVEQAEPGDEVAVSGPGRGYRIEVDAPAYLLAGDESALPAIGQLLGALPAATSVRVRVEIGHDDARMALPVHDRTTVEWHVAAPGASPGDALVSALQAIDLVPGERIWVAGEAAAVQRVRHLLFDVHGLGRSVATVRGYWKHGRAGDLAAGAD
jgi:NADPH-dependent ferric siderophore reductase